MSENSSATARDGGYPHSDRRAFPRVDTKFLAEVEHTGADSIPATVLDFSRVGLQLGCDRATAKQILNTAEKLPEDEAPATTIRMRLPLENGPSTLVRVRCRIVYCRSLETGGYRLGIQFKRFAEDGEAQVEAFVAECIRYE